MYSPAMPEPTKTIEGVAVHTVGHGPAVVLLHANVGDSTDFAAVREIGRAHV